MSKTRSSSFSCFQRSRRPRFKGGDSGYAGLATTALLPQLTLSLSEDSPLEARAKSCSAVYSGSCLVLVPGAASGKATLAYRPRGTVSALAARMCA